MLTLPPLALEVPIKPRTSTTLDWLAISFPAIMLIIPPGVAIGFVTIILLPFPKASRVIVPPTPGNAVIISLLIVLDSLAVLLPTLKVMLAPMVLIDSVLIKPPFPNASRVIFPPGLKISLFLESIEPV